MIAKKKKQNAISILNKANVAKFTNKAYFMQLALQLLITNQLEEDLSL